MYVNVITYLFVTQVGHRFVYSRMKFVVTSVTISLTFYRSQSTCRLKSFHLYLMSSGRAISLQSKRGNRYGFNELAPNTRHSVNVNFTFAHDVAVHTVSPGHVNTLASQRKFPKYYSHTYNVLDVSCTHVTIKSPYKNGY